jgi:prolyl-tRNA synthetase
MRYSELHIQTLREAPSNARTTGFAFLVRAGYITRENQLQPLGQKALDRIAALAKEVDFFSRLSLPVIGGASETHYPIPTGDAEVLHCPACGYASRRELAQFKKIALPAEEPAPLEKVLTPDCNTIESLAAFLSIPKAKTAKALMFTRVADGKFVFVVVRGDMTLSEAKLISAIGAVRLATTREITAAGAIPGYASPIGLKEALIVIDDLIMLSTNLVAGANEAGYHLKNTNCGRDYQPAIIADLILPMAGNACFNCGNPLKIANANVLATKNGFDFFQILLALAETHHDDKGLTLPPGTAPFDVYLMHVPGKMLDTKSAAEGLYNQLTASGLEVLFDDRDERAGVKFNDADLIGCPVRIIVGEKGLKEGMVELKPRQASEIKLISMVELPKVIDNLLSQTLEKPTD